jgi:hypothetical protein
MSQITSIEDRESELEFVRRAAAAFARNDGMATYGDIGPGELLAIRWGLHGRSIKVVKLDADFAPTIYGDAVQPTTGD